MIWQAEIAGIASRIFSESHATDRPAQAILSSVDTVRQARGGICRVQFTTGTDL